MKSLSVFLLSLLTAITMNAQVINGDLNHNDNLDVEDVTLLIDGYLTGETETVSPAVDPFMEDNSRIVGTWYNNSGTESITFREDGTTDYLTDCTYKYLPIQGYVFFFNPDGIPVMTLKLPYVTADYLTILPSGGDTPIVYTAKAYNNGYEYVDLGLSVKWATMNVGANAPEEYGDYFAWGELWSKDYYDWSNYMWCNDGSHVALTEYCTDSRFGTVDNKTVLEPEDDTAQANWGGTWRMPTFDEIEELKDNCSWEWTTQNGVYGQKVTGSNGNSIFLPAAGLRYNKVLADVDDYGNYWSSSICPGKDNRAYSLYFRSSDMGWSIEGRQRGYSVRAVCP